MTRSVVGGVLLIALAAGLAVIGAVLPRASGDTKIPVGRKATIETNIVNPDLIDEETRRVDED